MDKFLEAINSFVEARSELSSINKIIDEISKELAGAAEPAKIEKLNADLDKARSQLEKYKTQVAKDLSAAVSLDASDISKVIDAALAQNEKALDRLQKQVLDAQGRLLNIQTKLLGGGLTPGQESALKSQAKVIEDEIANLFGTTAISTPRQQIDNAITQSASNRAQELDKLKSQVPILKQLIKDYTADINSGSASSEDFRIKVDKLAMAKAHLAEVTSMLPTPMSGVRNALGVMAGAANSLQASFMRLGFAQFQLQMSLATMSGTFNQMAGAAINLQQQLLTLQGVYASLNRVFVADGSIEIKGAKEKIQALVVPMENAVTQIRQIALEISGATSQQLIDVFRVIAQNASTAKISLAESVELTRGFSAAMTTANIPLIQANQEIGSILQGQITQNSALAIQLGLNNAVIAQEKAKGTLAKFLNERFAEAIEIQKQHSRTWVGVTSNIQDYFELIQVALGKPMLEPMIQQLLKILDGLKKTQSEAERLATNVAGVFVRIGTYIKDVIESNGQAFVNIGRIMVASFSGVADAINIALTGVGVVVSGVLKLTQATGILSSDLIKISVTTGVIFALLQKINIEAAVLGARAFWAGLKVDLIFLRASLESAGTSLLKIGTMSAGAGIKALATSAVSANVALLAVAATIAIIYNNLDKLDKKKFGEGMQRSAEFALASYNKAVIDQTKAIERRDALLKKQQSLIGTAEKGTEAYNKIVSSADYQANEQALTVVNRQLGEYSKQTIAAASDAKSASDALTGIAADENNEMSAAAKQMQKRIAEALKSGENIASRGTSAQLVGGIGEAQGLKVREGLTQFRLNQAVNIEQQAQQILANVTGAVTGGNLTYDTAYKIVGEVVDNQYLQAETRLKALDTLQKLLEEKTKNFLANQKADVDRLAIAAKMGGADQLNVIEKTIEFEQKSYEIRLANLKTFYERKEKLLKDANEKEIKRLIEAENAIKAKLKASLEFKLDEKEVFKLDDQIGKLQQKFQQNQARLTQLSNINVGGRGGVSFEKGLQLSEERRSLQTENQAIAEQFAAVTAARDKAQGKGVVLSQAEGNQLIEQLKKTQAERTEVENAFVERTKRDRDAYQAQRKAEEDRRIQAEAKADEDRYNLARQRAEIASSQASQRIQRAEKEVQRDVLLLRQRGFRDELDLKLRQSTIESEITKERALNLRDEISIQENILANRRYMSAEERQKAQLAIDQKRLELLDLQGKEIENLIQREQILNEIRKVQPLEQQAQMLGMINKLLEAQNGLKQASLQLETAILDVSIKRSERAATQLKEGQAILRELGGEPRKEDFEAEKQANQETINNEKKRIALERLAELGISAGTKERQIAMDIYQQEMQTLQLKARRFELEESANKAKLEFELRSKEIAAQQEVIQARIALAKAEGTKDQRQIALAQAQVNLATEGLSITQQQGVIQRDLSKIQTEAAREQFNAEQSAAAFKLNQAAPDQMVFGARTPTNVFARRAIAPEGFLGSSQSALDILFRGQKDNDAVAALREDANKAADLIDNSGINATTKQITTLKSEVALTVSQFERLKGSIQSFPSLNITPVLSRFTGGYTPKSVPTLVNEQGQEAWTDLSTGQTQLFPFGARIVSLPNDAWVHNAQQTAHISNLTNPMAMVVDELRSLKQSLLSESRNLVLNFANDPRPDLTAYRVAREMLR